MRSLNKTISFVLCLAIFFTLFGAKPFVPTAHAVWGVADIGIDIPVGAGTWMDTGISVGNKIHVTIKEILLVMANVVLVVAKVEAVKGVQAAVAQMTGDDAEGGGRLIRDYEDYLYSSPQKKALEQMNAFFISTGSGYSSFDGFGSNYNSYLVAQGRQAIIGQAFKTTLQDQVSDPSQMFDGGNMKGLMSYMECSNNVACFTLTVESAYADAISKAQDIARSQQVNGFLPKLMNGRIQSPAIMAQNALLDVDNAGMKMIMDASIGEDGKKIGSAMTQILEGSALSIAARMGTYGITDSGK